MIHFVSPYDNVSTQHTDMEIWTETMSQGNGGRVAKTGGLGYMYAGAKRSSVLYREKYRDICKVSK